MNKINTTLATRINHIRRVKKVAISKVIATIKFRIVKNQSNKTRRQAYINVKKVKQNKEKLVVTLERQTSEQRTISYTKRSNKFASITINVIGNIRRVRYNGRRGHQHTMDKMEI